MSDNHLQRDVFKERAAMVSVYGLFSRRGGRQRTAALAGR